MQPRSALFKYQIGLLLFSVLTIILVGFLVVQSGNNRQDTKTYKAAAKIAGKLNNHIDKKQAVPKSLKEAGIDDVPSSVSYQKISEESYEFCITYKADSGSLDTSAAISKTLSGYYPNPSDYSNNTYLSVTANYKKGKTCQNVKPYFYRTPDWQYDSGTNLNYDPYFSQ